MPFSSDGMPEKWLRLSRRMAKSTARRRRGPASPGVRERRVSHARSRSRRTYYRLATDLLPTCSLRLGVDLPRERRGALVLVPEGSRTTRGVVQGRGQRGMQFPLSSRAGTSITALLDVAVTPQASVITHQTVNVLWGTKFKVCVVPPVQYLFPTTNVILFASVPS